jgi:hypothetical protein
VQTEQHQVVQVVQVFTDLEQVELAELETQTKQVLLLQV